MTLTINKKKVTLKYTIRAMMMYENMTQKSFAPSSITDVITFMYCIIVSSMKDYSFKFDEFIDYLDEHPDVLTQFSDWVQGNAEVNADLSKK